MIDFKKAKLDNGLTVIVHEDDTTPLAAVNILYNVGARDEDETKTGFAHLFEHLMFGGSEHISSYDEVVQKIGGSNNAFTSNDITNYYLTFPADNLETVFWLESDRMNQLEFSEKSLEVQRSVVIEEFKQRYLNQPYGEEMLLLRPLAYKTHPYKWATIGKEIEHIETATLEDVKSFFYKHYAPNNAIMVVSGNVDFDNVFALAKKWFGDIPVRDTYKRNLPIEPKQNERRFLEVEKNVPADSLVMSFHMCSKTDPNYYAIDLLSDVLSRGNSSRLYQNLVKNNPVFSELNAYVSGSSDAGMFMIKGQLNEGVEIETAEQLIWKELEDLKQDGVEETELQRSKNKIESSNVFGEMSILNKAMNLAFAELQEDASLVNNEFSRYEAVTTQQVKDMAKNILVQENASVLYYKRAK